MSKAIVVVSFGTANLEAIKKLDLIENQIRETVGNKYKVIRAFTSKVLVNILKATEGISIPRLEEVLFNLNNDGYTEVIVQPLHVMDGGEYASIEKTVNEYYYSFHKIKIGKSILGYMGEELKEACKSLVNAIMEQIPQNKNIVFVGHGSKTITSEVYYILEEAFKNEGYNNVYIGTLEGERTKESVLNRLRKDNIDDVILMSLLILPGNHAKKDIAGEERSWYSTLRDSGINVELSLKPLIEYAGVREIYINNIKKLL
ncbi:sirohydrochlorin cobaltochelatase [Clostridium sp.]|uniref:sirohydrochlorin cobaltochelatase n=1 Tax=Clostridium sp. TaxID=1506 RepID=UPI003F348CF1